MPAQPGVLRYGLSKFEWFIVFLVCLMLLLKIGQAKWPVSDARVYVRAAQNLLEGETLYQRPEFYEFYRFKYPPTAALFFLPLTLIPFWLTRVIMAALTLVSLLFIIRVVEAWGPPVDHTWGRVFIFLAFGGMIHYEFHLGQVTLIVLAGLVIVADWLDDKRDWSAAALFSLTLHLKPFGWPVLLWAAYRGRNTFLFGTIIISLLLAASILPFVGVQHTVEAWKGFVHEMGILTSSEVNAKQSVNLSFGGAVANWTGFTKKLPARWKPWSIAAISFSPLLFLLMFLWARIPEAISDSKREIAWVLAAVPLVGPSEYKYFQFLIPLAWMGLGTWSEMPAGRRSLLAIGMICLGINIYDLWGKTISTLLTNFDVVTLGGILIFWTGFQTTLRPNIGAVDVEKQMATRLGWIPRPTADQAFWYKIALVIAISVLSTAAYFRNQTRMVCRTCEEESAPATTICKNCGSTEMVLFPDRTKELERVTAAEERLHELCGEGSQDANKKIQALGKVQSEFADISPADWQRLMKRFR